jgi:Leucine-rich repeat (LRR) protein
MNCTTSTFWKRIALPLSIFMLFSHFSFAQTTSCRVSDSLELVKLYNATNGANWFRKWNLQLPMTTWEGITLNANGCVKSINLNDNGLIGILPNSIGSFSALEGLTLARNQLTGNLPISIGNLSNLLYISVGENALTGSIPSSITMLSKLEGIALYKNQLSGEIPRDFANLKKLTVIHLENNQLSGSLPTGLGSLNLVVFFLHHNQLSGCFPNDLRGLCTTTIDFTNNPGLPNNGQTGIFCLNNSGACDSVSCLTDTIKPVIFCPDNIIVSTVNAPVSVFWFEPRVSDNCGYAYRTSNYKPNDTFAIGTTTVIYTAKDAKNNTATCSFNITVTVNNPCATDITPPVLSNCPTNINLTTATTNAVATWTAPTATDNCAPPSVSSNYNAGSAFAIGTTTVIYTATDAKNNTATCKFNITVLNVNGSCHLRDSLYLVEFYNKTNGQNWINKWDLTKPMNTWFGVLVNPSGCLTSLELRNNQLNGNIPNSIGLFDSLSNLYLSNNQLRDTIPNVFSNLKKLFEVDLSNNQLSGFIPNSITACTALAELRLNNNQLRGSIPSNIGNLQKLNLLLLNNNILTGRIPSSLSQIPILTVLELQSNQITDTIPTDVVKKNSLYVLKLDNNLFYGCLPIEMKQLCNKISATVTLINNPSLPNGGDFDAFCSSNFGACNPPATANCKSNSLSPWSEWIAKVQLANLSNASSKTRDDRFVVGYSDWTDKTATVSRGQAYPLSITPGLSWAGYQTNLFFRAWIDFNNNGVYEDTELVLEKNSVSGAVNQSVTIPATTSLGTVRMRISMKKDAYPAACETFAAGEVEDYSVTISNGTVDPCATDVTPPILSTCPATINLTTTGTSAIATWTAPTATDNCGTPSVSSNYNSGFAFPIGLTSVVYTAVDAKSNKAACSFTVTVTSNVNPCANDVTPPVFIGCPSNITLTTTGTTAVGPWIGPGATDNCGTISVSSNFPTQVFPIGSSTVIYTATDAKNNTATCSFNVTVTKITPPTTVCPSKGTAPWELWISKVQFNTINNTSEKFKDYATLGYSDYTNLSTTLTHGQIYSLSITPSLSWAGNSLYNCWVWIDYNKNNIFDTEELVLSQQNHNPFKADIKIPTTAAVGNVRMRITLKLDSFPTACETFEKGEVEDYTLTLQRGAAPPSNCRTNDSLALVDVYNSMGGATWANKWDLTKPMNTWFGVATDTNGCVIVFSSRQLNGNLSPSIGNLSQLQIMRLGGSQAITGTIPNSFGNLSNLEELSLEENKLTGSIPSSIGNLVNLQQVLLYQNMLTGSIPSSFSNLNKIVFLVLNNNQLSGEIPSSLSTMSKLAVLILSNNSFTGKISNVFGSMPRLSGLDLSNNKFSDTLPKNLALLTNILTLKLSNNLLSGCIPNEYKALCGKDITLTGNVGLPNGGDWAAFCSNNTGICTTTPAADIALTIASTPATYRPWTTTTIRVTAKNIGTTAMTNVVIELKRPAKMSHGGNKTPSVGTFNDYCAGGVECAQWTIPTLAAGATATLDAPFFVLDAIAPIVATTKLLSSTPVDGNATNNTATFSITPQTVVAQAVSKPTQLIPVVIQSIAPNPTDGELRVQLESLDAREVRFDFYNALGKTVKTETKAVEKGLNRIEFSVLDFEQGVYFVLPVTNQGHKVPTKFVKL